ncbi:peroxiredoxin [Candidatus Saccharibacteria bacterium]|nr:peroxiredoxin [Candidatus Saccharibacteria bacterium]NCU40593.1 peroxiredoxin [Candidatus Saccharibacteria bacterium]
MTNTQKLQAPYLAPDFSLIDHDGKRVELGDFRGSWLVLYFYPKDNTPGCTVEACSFRDSMADIRDLDTKVVGISRDNPESHRKFKAKHNLPFQLLSDPRAETASAYGAWGKKMFGREGARRKTFLIDPNGVIQKVYDRVSPMEYGPKVVAELKHFQGRD